MEEDRRYYYGYVVSNLGRVFNKHGKEVKGYVKHDKQYSYRVVVLRINKERKIIDLSSLVCRLFNPDYRNGAKVYHIDGNINNCAIYNLKISKAYTLHASRDAVATYEREVLSCVKHFFHKNGYCEAKHKGIDVDNAIGNAYMLIWKYLPCYKVGTSFYVFCSRYCMRAFLYEVKKEKNYQKLKRSEKWKKTK